MKLLSKTKHVVEVRDWDTFVTEVYKRPYSFQQQEGCKQRGTWEFSIPFDDDWDYEEETYDEIPIKVNGERMGVKFGVWLSKDPEEKFFPDNSFSERLFWGRNFYPDKNTLVKDLEKKELLPEGDYIINIDW
jgi:hypothetical protein